MKFAYRAGIFAMIGAAVVVAGCSGSGGGGILDNPSGSIVITDGVTGKVLNTSEASPYLVSGLSFSIDATEQHFDGPYTVKIISQENLPTASNGGDVYGYTFSAPCFVVSQVDTFKSSSVPISFNGSNANGQPGNYPDGGVPTPGPNGAAPTTSGNPCHSGEFEVAQISDSDGHSVNFYYEEYHSPSEGFLPAPLKPGSTMSTVEPDLASLRHVALPRHVAIIMDGNRRWPKAALAVHRGTPAWHYGPAATLRALRAIFGIEMLTVYGFSTENWKRESTEVSLLFDLCVYFASSELAELVRNNVRVRIIGEYQAFPKSSRDALERLVANTQHNTGLQLNLAVNYSARAELRIAIEGIARDVKAGTLDPAAIDERTVESYLATADMPDPDLLIRPGGEARLSNFLLYQLADAEFYVTETYWPDFDRAHFERALDAYRTRRAGGA